MADIKFENYVLSRCGTRLIRKILIANNGRASPYLPIVQSILVGSNRTTESRARSATARLGIMTMP